MPQILIDRMHGLPLPQAQSIARAWVQSAQDDFGMQTQQLSSAAGTQGQIGWHFKRAGASGTLRVTPERFVLELTLGFLLGTYKDRIEAGLLQSLAQRLETAATKQGDSAVNEAFAPKS